jgi:hypothetical protein
MILYASINSIIIDENNDVPQIQNSIIAVAIYNTTGGRAGGEDKEQNAQWKI